jgi:hypothetical protein
MNNYTRPLPIFMLTVLWTLGMNGIAFSESIAPFVSLASFGRNHCEQGFPAQIRSSEPNFRTGLDWGVLSLGETPYHGVATVVSHGENICPGYADTSSVLAPSTSYPPESQELLLIRPIPSNFSEIFPQAIVCTALPPDLQTVISTDLQTAISRLKVERIQFTSQPCYIVDIDADGISDIVKAKVMYPLGESELVYVYAHPSWVLKYRHDIYLGPE